MDILEDYEVIVWMPDVERFADEAEQDRCEIFLIKTIGAMIKAGLPFTKGIKISDDTDIWVIDDVMFNPSRNTIEFDVDF